MKSKYVQWYYYKGGSTHLQLGHSDLFFIDWAKHYIWNLCRHGVNTMLFWSYYLGTGNPVYSDGYTIAFYFIDTRQIEQMSSYESVSLKKYLSYSGCRNLGIIERTPYLICKKISMVWNKMIIRQIRQTNQFGWNPKTL